MFDFLVESTSPTSSPFVLVFHKKKDFMNFNVIFIELRIVLCKE